MTCRHQEGDPACSSGRSPEALYEKGRKLVERYGPPTPDAESYEVVEAVQCGPHLVLRVRYPSCEACAYEGQKLLVFANTTPLEALKWKRIDPHFRDPEAERRSNDAPPPCGRFPASDEGWADALAFAKVKTHG